MLILSSIVNASDTEKCNLEKSENKLNQLDSQLLKIQEQIISSELEGEYIITSGPKECPTGRIVTTIDKKNLERIFLFGSSHSWSLTMLDKSMTKEVVDGGCTYVQEYEKTNKSFICKTTKSNCPRKNEEGIIVEKISLNDKDLSYEFQFNNKNFKCKYKKGTIP